MVSLKSKGSFFSLLFSLKCLVFSLLFVLYWRLGVIDALHLSFFNEREKISILLTKKKKKKNLFGFYHFANQNIFKCICLENLNNTVRYVNILI